MLGLGIDCGSTTTKGVLFDGEKIVKHIIVPTNARPKQSMELAYNELFSSKVGFTVATGYGRNLMSAADKSVTEITCHAHGAAVLHAETTAIIDIGGQDSKAILLDGNKNVSDFIMNDKCAAGTGRFVEMMCRILDCDIAKIDEFVLGKNAVDISSMCTVFAESEIISLLADGADRGDIALGVVESICVRTANLAQKIRPYGDIFFSGGLAQYEVFRMMLEKHMELPVKTCEMSQMAGALGAAVIAFKRKK